MQPPTRALLLLSVGALLATASAQVEDRTITKVVQLLQGMLETSKDDAATDSVMYNKYKCFADISDAAKTKSIKTLTEEIAIHENKIGELQGENGQLSNQVSALNKDIAANSAADIAAGRVRTSSNGAFVLMETDLVTAIGQMGEALDILKSIALTQTQTAFLAGATEHKQEIALTSKQRDALVAVSALLPTDGKDSVQSFLQAKSSKRGNAIVQILTALQTTFDGNLVSARDTEVAEVKAFNATVALLESSRGTMNAALKVKQDKVGENDAELSTSKSSYEIAVRDKGIDEEALATLTTEATTKAGNFAKRKMLRANEDAALAQAVSILNSDAAFSGFAETKATSTGGLSFLQVRQTGGNAKLQAMRALEQGHSSRLAHVAAGLRAGNAFEEVVKEINKMKQVIIDESTADTEKKSWCETERTNSGADSGTKGAAILALQGELDILKSTIGSDDDPKTGLMESISDEQTNLLQNQKDQTTATKLRKEEKAIYLKDMKSFNNAEDLLKRSIKVLTRYYNELDEKYLKGATLVQKSSQDPENPDVAGKGTLGAHSTAGASAIEMLEFILGETEKERGTAETTEGTAQSTYDTETLRLTGRETSLGESVVNEQGSLATSQGDFQEKTSDLKDTNAAKAAIDDYLLKIKPGCDFIAANFQLREQNRGTETTALNNAIGLIEGSPVYEAAIAAAAKK